MVRISCFTKFWSFALAEQMQKNGKLSKFYTGFSSQLFPKLSSFSKRKDLENLNPELIKNYLVLSFGAKFFNHPRFWLDLFDQNVSNDLDYDTDYDIFIGWSGSSLKSLQTAKKNGKQTIIERGSSHILFQNEILNQEYSFFNKKFNINLQTIKNELEEYKLADYISVPSNFVLNSFIEKGVDKKKLILNPYGAGKLFSPQQRNSSKFRILYLGTLNIRKGLLYLFKALKDLKIPKEKFEVWFIGTITEEINPIIKEFMQSNWIFWGYKQHTELSNLISQCDVKVHPSIEEGLSMVIPQVLKCGVPVIATTNTGGDMVIKDNFNGFIIPIRNSKAIEEKISYLYQNKFELLRLKSNAIEFSTNSWDDYGDKYVSFLKGIM